MNMHDPESGTDEHTTQGDMDRFHLSEEKKIIITKSIRKGKKKK